MNLSLSKQITRSLAAPLSLDGNTLKSLALLAMLFDHIVYTLAFGLAIIEPFGELYMLLRIPGRITAPIMCFFIAEGFHYTKDLAAYFKRLLLLAVLSHIPYVLFFDVVWWKTTSIIFGFVLGLIALIIATHQKIPLVLKVLTILVCCAFSLVSTFDTLVVLWILFFGLFHHRPKAQLLSFTLIALFGGLSSIGYQLLTDFAQSWYMVGMLLAIPLLWCYNNERGQRTAFSQYGFYVFYPLHHLLLYIVILLGR